jgi:hypothetical protein
MKKIFFAAPIPKALVDMATASGQVFIHLRHKSCHDTMSISYFFNGGFKQGCPVGRFKNSRVGDRGFISARSGFRMNAFQWDTEFV